MISQINITVNAAKPKFPLAPMVAFNGSPSSVRISGVPCSIGNWSINSVSVLVSYPNNFTVEKTAVKVDDFWIATIDGSQTNGVIKNGFQVIADGVDENNLPVTGYVLGVGDVVVVPRDKGIEKLVQKYAMRYLNEPPTNPSIGDLLNLNGNVRIWDGSKWIFISGEDVVVYDSAITLQANGVEFDSFTLNASEAKTIDIPVPSKTSELDNDSGFITSAAIPSKVSELDNDAGYITSSAIPSMVGAFENDVGYLTSVSWGEVQNKPDVALLSDIPSKVSELDNDAGYITMSAIPAIPSKTSELDNDSGFITLSAIPSQISSFENDVGYLSAVTWNDVQNKPAIPSKVSELDNDAGFITEAAIPSNVSEFNNDAGYLSAVTWNDVSGKPNIPSNTSDLVNDSGFITSAALSGYATENYVDGKVLALSSIYALDSDLDLVVASVSSMDGSIQTIDASVQNLELNVSDIQTYVGELGLSIYQLNASVSSIQTSLSTYATISYVDSQIGSINTILDNINGEVI